MNYYREGNILILEMDVPLPVLHTIKFLINDYFKGNPDFVSATYLGNCKGLRIECRDFHVDVNSFLAILQNHRLSEYPSTNNCSDHTLHNFPKARRVLGKARENLIKKEKFYHEYQSPGPAGYRSEGNPGTSSVPDDKVLPVFLRSSYY